MSNYLQKRYEELGKPSLNPWGDMAIESWENAQPEMVAELKSQNLLIPAAVVAQDQAAAMFERLVSDGIDPRTAREMAIHDCLYAPEQAEDLDPQEKLEGENNQIQAFLKLLAQRDETLQPTPATTVS